MIFMVLPFFARAGTSRVLEVVGIMLGLVVLYSVLHLAIARFMPNLNPWLGAVLAVAPVLGVFLVGGDSGQVAAVTFVGLSLLLAAVRADAGCEVMSMPGVFFGRRTHLVCILFSPIDWLEEKVSSRS